MGQQSTFFSSIIKPIQGGFTHKVGQQGALSSIIKPIALATGGLYSQGGTTECTLYSIIKPIALATVQGGFTNKVGQQIALSSIIKPIALATGGLYSQDGTAGCTL